MSNLQEFGAYAADFEKTLLDDDWVRLEQYFAEEATYLPGDGTCANGRAASLQALRDSVSSLEKKCDSRELLGEPEVSESGNTITLKYSVRYGCSGHPDYVLSGIETIDYSGGKIVRMEDVFEDPAGLEDWRGKL